MFLVVIVTMLVTTIYGSRFGSPNPESGIMPINSNRQAGSIAIAMFTNLVPQEV